MRALLAVAATAVLGLAVLAARPELVARAAGGRIASASGGGVEARPTAAVEPVVTRVTERPYAVVGGRPGEVLFSMAARAPRVGGETFFGLTVTEMAFRYVREPVGEGGAAGCTLRDVQVVLDVSVALPAWTAGPGADAGLEADWERFARNLRGHEDEHRVIAERGAEQIYRELDGLTAPTCFQADAAAQRVAERVRIQTDAAHRRYDDETGHGATQGATWPVR